MYNKFKITSETSLLLYLEPPISIEKQRLCYALNLVIKDMPYIKEVVVGMNTLYVLTSDLNYKDLLDLQSKLNELITSTKPLELSGRLIEIPVDYGGDLGLDLKVIAKAKGMSMSEFAKLHAEPIYDVYFIGFQPGFAYLGGLNEILHTPRLSTPRLKIPAGSVGIGGAQTGIYPYQSPGGWNIIGNTKAKLFDVNSENPSLLKAGDRLKFVINSIKERL
ncbi:5-oxoprolinase subunit PxpB [Campylobacter sp. RM12640]|uniref:5-oxoprolinase subunit PxpB n=1 Tax=unclassified Campylobacter TaxID=2593542 RepID=UPI001BDB225F|nr:MULTISPECIES: 5-oxoprolinase subunit PxpB [unclassified Campylobacter]MBZ7976777.1 5-oxoprolinase subunit PxpB [Campylobacter sp. RM12637]MBZ7980811.1 5-oxoprolinase subunit PxpB [Campylobacter sp. RM12642]MBZ7982291.1 5-oxoprolinase subunit PxpB [Campylobacter sp. RM12640]MBZ7989443.1 5-oxoprolinase subunit PxpB [Campylobacter sp. RM12635]MBZ7991690.1 5-oxoprolinase subunit PxpB [Campylobacter sp. RM9331]MBZ7993414.1 5-oxoprolinase subunit PxpB [Campylobacter sp. RM9333]MBZ8006459.1 5-ox